MVSSRTIRCSVVLLAVLVAVGASTARGASGDEAPASTAGLIRRLADTRMDSNDSSAARQAWEQLVQADASVLPEILDAMERADVIGINWLGAFDAIVRREQRSATPAVPWDALKARVTDPRTDGRARRWALDWIERERPGTTKRLLPALLGDPEFRQNAIELLTAEVQAALAAGQTNAAKDLYQRALAASTDYDQVVASAAALERLGERLDLRARLGVPADWRVLGPFPGHGLAGFARPYPPSSSCTWPRNTKASPDPFAGGR